jgi:hypothetical protein
MKGSFYEELEHILGIFYKYHTTVLLDFNAKADREDIFKLKIGIQSLYKMSNNNGVVNFATSKNLVKSTMFPHHNIHKYTWMSKQGSHKFHVETFNLNTLDRVEDKEKYRVVVSNRFTAL